jgi:hypothetical protein
MLGIANKPLLLSVIMLNVIMLNVIMLNVIMLNVVVPIKRKLYLIPISNKHCLN